MVTKYLRNALFVAVAFLIITLARRYGCLLLPGPQFSFGHILTYVIVGAATLTLIEQIAEDNDTFYTK